MLSHHYLFAVDDVQSFLQALYVGIALDESAVGAVGVSLSVVRLDAVDAGLHAFHKEEVLPLVGLLIGGKAFHGNLQGTAPLVDVVQCLCATGWGSGCAADELGYVHAVREGFLANTFHVFPECKVVQVAATREGPVANLLHAVANGHVLQSRTAVELVVAYLVFLARYDNGAQRCVTVEGGITIAL